MKHFALWQPFKKCQCIERVFTSRNASGVRQLRFQKILIVRETSGNRHVTGRILLSQAFRALAKIWHPDKGGNAERFGRLQASFEILSDPKKRAVYDTWAKELQFRYVRGVVAKVAYTSAVHTCLYPVVPRRTCCKETLVPKGYSVRSTG